ncbi:MAG: PSD1 and planctomycete cytochrome C domain-containing protein [Planctomycetota bacterium]
MRVLLAGVLLLLGGSSDAAEKSVDFNRDIRPILSDRCFHCHGPDEADRQAELRLDQADGETGAYRELGGIAAIVPGDAAASEVWARIISDDPDLAMPPPYSHKEPLSETEKANIRAWINSGAEYQDFWAFIPPKMPEVPAEDISDDKPASPIDHFVRKRLAEEGLTAAPRADKRTLIRRVSLDLTGLPPTPDEIEAFANDTSPDAFEKLVDRLLASPHYGEHLARYWLDLVRFADTNGMHHDHYRDMSPYRDWVIRSFNDNLPYDDFTRYQIAGDLYPEPTRDQLVASGFHRLHLIIDVGTALPEESFTKNVLDRVTSVGTAFMGLTVQCAVCHDHKYDPITAKDFFALSAFFNNIDAQPETDYRRTSAFYRGLQDPYINLTTDEQEVELTRLGDAVDAARATVEARRADNNAATDESAKRITTAALEQAEAELKRAQKALDAYLMPIPGAMVMKEREEQRPAHILIRGAYDNPGEVVERNTPEFLPPLQVSGDTPSRMDLANWLVSRENPLTARVAVNRLWQQLFGVGLVKTSEDFGAQGEWPSHPRLLDYLTVRFLDQGWDVKALLKEMVLSETYQQASDSTPAMFRQDPRNRLLARGSRFRLDAEVVRDHLLATSGLLNRQLYGKSVKPPQPDGLWKAVAMPHSYPRVYSPDTGPSIYRRSVYTYWKRGMPPPQMTILNAPSREECTARRERTNTPLQALLLLNEPEYLKAAGELAHTVLKEEADSDSAGFASGERHAKRVESIFETITSYKPDATQVASLIELADDLFAYYEGQPGLARKLCGDREPPAGASRSEWAAWTMVASTVYNLDVTKTRQ